MKKIIPFLQKYYLVILLAIPLIICFLFLFKKIVICKEYNFVSDFILWITALILLWYTKETYVIAQATKRNMEITEERYRKPVVGLEISPNTDDINYTRFRIINQSEGAISVLVKCNFKINGEPIIFHPAYEGTEYWNLQYTEVKEVPIHWIDLCVFNGLIEPSFGEEMKKYSGVKITDVDYPKKEIKNDSDSISKIEKLSMDVEIFCENEYKSAYYPPAHYDYSLKKKIWVPKVTSKKPYWKYDSIPSWVKKTLENDNIIIK
ncbi:hypothetical protein ACFL6P_00330 [Candidatus Latescibacterota bacterium]